MEVETKMKATITMDANDKEELEKAQAAHEKLTDTKKSTDMLKNVQKVLKEDTGIEVEVPEVTEKYRVDVKVETDIVAVSENAVVLPTGDELKEVAEKAGAEDIEVKEVVVKTPSPLPPGVVESSTTTTTIGETSKISSSSVSFPQFAILTLALAAPLLA